MVSTELETFFMNTCGLFMYCSILFGIFRVIFLRMFLVMWYFIQFFTELISLHARNKMIVIS